MLLSLAGVVYYKRTTPVRGAAKPSEPIGEVKTSPANGLSLIVQTKKGEFKSTHIDMSMEDVETINLMGTTEWNGVSIYSRVGSNVFVAK